MKYLYLSITIWLFTGSSLFAGAETINRDGKVTFAYDEAQIEVDDFNAKSATATMTNKYTKPSAFETLASTTSKANISRYSSLLTKGGVLGEIKKQKSELTLLKSIEDDEGIDTSAEQAIIKQKLAGLKHAYSLAP